MYACVLKMMSETLELQITKRKSQGICCMKS